MDIPDSNESPGNKKYRLCSRIRNIPDSKALPLGVSYIAISSFVYSNRHHDTITNTNSTSNNSIASTTATNKYTCTTGNAPRILRIAVGSTNPSKIAAVQQAFGKAVNDVQSLSDNDDDDNHNDRLQLDIQGFSVASGVPDQPYGDQETSQGAKNRAVAAYRAYKEATGNTPHFAVGMEGGLEWWSPIATMQTQTQTQTQTTQGTATTVNDDNDDYNDDDDGNETDSKDRLLLCMAWMCVYGRRQAFTVDALASEETTKYTGDKKPIFGVAKTASFVLPPTVASLIQDKGMELGDADDQIFGRVNGKHGSGTVGILSKGLIDRSAYYEHAILLALVPWFRPDVYPNGLRSIH